MTTQILDAELRAFVESGVSVTIAGRDASNAPHVARALGCLWDGDLLVVLLDAHHGRDVLADLRENRAIAVVCSEPPTHRTVQIKGRDAVVSDATDAHRRRLIEYRTKFDDALTRVGFGNGYAEMLTRCDPASLKAIAFSPIAAYVQTPGPSAGRAIGASAASGS